MRQEHDAHCTGTGVPGGGAYRRAGVGAGATANRHLAFEQTWPEVEAELRRWLAARRVPVADRDDYVQEVAARVLVSKVPLHSYMDVLRWSLAVLRNLHIDRVRSRLRVQVIDGGLHDGFPASAGSDVAAQVAARMDLAVVAEEISSWSPAQRTALLHDESSGTRRPSGFYVARHRLRLRLLAAIDGVASIAIGLWRRVEPGDVDRTSAVVLIPPAALACFVSLMLLDARGGADASERATQPGVSRAADGVGRADVEAGLTASSRPSVSSGTGDGGRPAAPRPAVEPLPPSRVLIPEYERIEVDAPGRPYVEVDNDHGKRPLVCVTTPEPLPDVCPDPII